MEMSQLSSNSYEERETKQVRRQRQWQQPGFRSVREHVTLSIRSLLSQLPPHHTNHCIYRIPDSLRKANPECYTPRLVAIGPLHRNNPRLKPMEEFKFRFLKSFLAKTDKVLDIIDFVVREEPAIRRHYQEEIKLSAEDFSQMIFLDSVFIVELLLKKEGKDTMFENRWWFSDMLHDLLLIENQVPLFVPNFIYYEYNCELESGQQRKFAELVHSFFKDIKNASLTPFSFDQSLAPKHIIDYLRMGHIPQDPSALNPVPPLARNEEEDHIPQDPSALNPVPPLARNEEEEDHIPQDPSSLNPVPPLARNEEEDHIPQDPSALNPVPPLPRNDEEEEKKNEKWKSDAATVSRLLEYGVKLNKETTTSLVKIQFDQKEGILTIPRVKVNEWTETLFRNIVAYEQCHRISPRYMSDYIIFMDSLIDTPKDVSILIKADIIQDDLQDPEKVSELFNNLYKEAITEDRDFYFARQSRELNYYRRHWWHRWKARWFKWKLILKRDYFNSPWSTISFIAAVILLGLTIVQTVCSIYQAKGIKM